MKIWIKTLIKDRFFIEVLQDDDIAKVKLIVKEHLLKLGVYVPPEQRLVHKGIVLQDIKKLSDAMVEDEDYCLFLYDLKAKPPEPIKDIPPPIQPKPTQPIPTQPESDKTIIDSIISSFSNFRQQPESQSPSQPHTEIIQPIQSQPPPPPIHQAPWRPPSSQSLPRHDPNTTFLEQEGTALLMGMGFSRSKALKALRLNDLDYQLALDWLLAHPVDIDMDIDNPLTPSDVSMNPLDSTIESTPSRKEAIKNAISKRICTYKVTGSNFEPQNWYQCFTCGLVENEGVCESCAAVCHEGHVLSEMNKSGQFFCDCGLHAEAHNCKCVNNK